MPRTLEDVAFVQNIVSKGLGYPLAQSRLGSASNPANVLLARLVKHKLGSMSPMSEDRAGAALLQWGFVPCSFVFVFATLVSLAWGWKYVMISHKGADQRHLVSVGRVLWHRLGVELKL